MLPKRLARTVTPIVRRGCQSVTSVRPSPGRGSRRRSIQPQHFICARPSRDPVEDLHQASSNRGHLLAGYAGGRDSLRDGLANPLLDLPGGEQPTGASGCHRVPLAEQLAGVAGPPALFLQVRGILLELGASRAQRPPTPRRPDPRRGTAARKRAVVRDSRSRRGRSPSQHQTGPPGRRPSELGPWPYPGFPNETSRRPFMPHDLRAIATTRPKRGYAVRSIEVTEPHLPPGDEPIRGTAKISPKGVVGPLIGC